MKTPLVPCSDGAGVVDSVGAKVSRFSKGDKVCTLFNQGHIAGSLTPKTVMTGLGGALDGTLREYGVFDENGLVAMPEGLDFLQGATLTCAGLTAWDALYGLKGNELKAGDVVLTQGTGGVSVFAVQVSFGHNLPFGSLLWISASSPFFFLYTHFMSRSNNL